MTDVLDHLTKALSDRYQIERELGSVGMATVYLPYPSSCPTTLLTLTQTYSRG